MRFTGIPRIPTTLTGVMPGRNITRGLRAPSPNPLSWRRAYATGLAQHEADKGTAARKPGLGMGRYNP